MCKEILLTQGKVAIVDDCDFERANSLKWTYDKGGNKPGYAYRKVREPLGNGKYKVRHLSLQNFIMDVEIGVIVDHKNRNSLDYRRNNLRVATRAQNNANSGPRGNAKYKGITRHTRDNYWGAQITTEGKYHHLGCFLTPEAAAKAYDQAAYAAWGEFAWLNFPDQLVFSHT